MVGARKALIGMTLAAMSVAIGCSLVAPSDEEATAGLTPEGGDADASDASDASDADASNEASNEASTCKGKKLSCTRSSECCTGLNCRRGTGFGARDECTTCEALGASCFAGSDCCSGPCEAGKCAACRTLGSPCASDNDCCSHDCDGIQDKCR